MLNPSALRDVLRNLLRLCQPTANEPSLSPSQPPFSADPTVDELATVSDSVTECLPALPLPGRTRIWIRILIFVISAIIMIALLATGLHVAAATFALIYIGVIAVGIADRIMSAPARRAPRTA